MCECATDVDAAARVGREHATYQVLRPLRNAAPARSVEIELRLRDLLKEGLTLKRWDPAQEYVENNADGPHVRSFAVTPDARDGVSPLEHLGRKVLRRAAVRPKPVVSRQLGEAEVRDLNRRAVRRVRE